MKISNRVRRLRFDRGEMTQQQLAQAADVTRQTIIAIESGRFAPSLELAFRISDALGVSLQDVFFRETSENNALDTPSADLLAREHKSRVT